MCVCVCLCVSVCLCCKLYCENKNAAVSCAGVDSKRTEKARCGLLIVVCRSLVKLDVVHTSAPSFPYPSEEGLSTSRDHVSH